MEKNELLNSALQYLKNGYSIIPVGRNKVPYIRWEDFQTRLATEGEVCDWWEKWPDANVGIVTGKISNLTVVDVEAGGDISKFPETTTIKTGGGGWHFYYAYHPISNMARVYPLTDVRGDGGYVVAPPSKHASGEKYIVLKKAGRVKFPIELFQNVKINTVNLELDRMLNDVIPEGERNSTATSICGKLLLRFRPEEWESQAWPLFQAWNETHNNPPLGTRELMTIFESISQAETRRQSSSANVGEPILLEEGEDKHVISVPIIDGFVVFEFEDVEYGAKSIETILTCSIEMPPNTPIPYVQRINILSSSARTQLATQLNQAFPVLKGKIGWPLIISQAFSLLEESLKKHACEDEYDETISVNTKYLIKPFIEDGVSNIIFGMGGTGKTFLSLRMAISLALNTSFLGLMPEKQANSLFIDYENNRNVWASRISKILNSMKITDRTAIKKSMFYFDTKGVPIHELKKQILDIIHKRNIELLIVDSAALACGGQPESAEIATRMFNALNRFGVAVLLIAHETKGTDNKNKTPFGSIFFYNCARNIWNVEREQEQDEAIIHVGLFHRKANNDSLAGVRSARMFFGDNVVDINPEDAARWSKEMSIKKAILGQLREGISTVDEIAENTGRDREQVRVRLQEMKKKGLVESPSQGVWTLPNYTRNSE